MYVPMDLRKWSLVLRPLCHPYVRHKMMFEIMCLNKIESGSRPAHMDMKTVFITTILKQLRQPLHS
jgi:hypothetical protein